MLRTSALLSCLLLITADYAGAFCGFYVAKADTKLYNQASKVVLVRDGNRTVLTMVNDYQGDPAEFAMIVPVPTFIEREQIHVTEGKYIEHLDAYSAPRLVEYHDADPCLMAAEERVRLSAMDASKSKATAAASLGVTVEAEYTVGEYSILILSAEESGGLETWLRQNDYRIPDGAGEVLGSYIKQKMRFFVAKVDLAQKRRAGFSYLRPLQVAYESPKFTLPIRLGTVNAKGPQELFVFVLNRTGRVETTNYRTVKLPSEVEIPLFVRDRFSDFYRDMFSRQVEQHQQRAVFVEYAWDMAWCDPCAAEPLSRAELRELGVFWLGDAAGGGRAQAQNAFVTRLHLRYSAATFPEDLIFQETGDRSNFQGRYILRHPWTGKSDCEAAKRYRKELPAQRAKRARTLAELTGWELSVIQKQMDLPALDERKWYQKIWD